MTITLLFPIRHGLQHLNYVRPKLLAYLIGLFMKHQVASPIVKFLNYVFEKTKLLNVLALYD